MDEDAKMPGKLLEPKSSFSTCLNYCLISPFLLHLFNGLSYYTVIGFVASLVVWVAVIRFIAWISSNRECIEPSVFGKRAAFTYVLHEKESR